jgi:CRP/FNR family cyclic AMP-dependent transcriptional regulator
MDERNVRRTTNLQEVASLLKQTPIFSRVADDTLEGMLASTIQRTVHAGKKIVEQGKEGIGFYLILEGSAEVSKGDVRLAELKRGDFFGELSCIDAAPRTADVVATSETTCLVIPQWEMKSVIQSCPSVALGMVEELVRRLRASNAALDTL